MAVNQENSTEWDFTKARNPALGIADSLAHKDNPVKKRTLIRLGCVDARTHTPLSLSHYQLAFHPVSHPSVQMVRKAASMLSLSLLLLCYTRSFRKN